MLPKNEANRKAAKETAGWGCCFFQLLDPDTPEVATIGHQVTKSQESPVYDCQFELGYSCNWESLDTSIIRESNCPTHITNKRLAQIFEFRPYLGTHTEKAMVPHCSTVAWKIPWMEEPGRLQSMGSWRVRHDRATSLSLFTFMHWRRKWQPTPVFLPGESQWRGKLVGWCLWGCTELDTTEAT